MGKRFHVLLLSHGLVDRFGGSAISEASLCQGLQSLCELTVFCRHEITDPSFVQKYNLKNVLTYHPCDILLAWSNPNHPLNRQFTKADVFHLNGHWRWEHTFFVELCRRYSVPYILQPRGMFLVNHRRPFLKTIFNLVLGNHVARHASKVVALSHFELSQFVGYPIAPQRIEVIPNGVTLQEPLCEKDEEPILPRGFFLYVGRLNERKNLLEFLRCFKEYLIRGGEKNLVFMGPAEASYQVKMEKLIHSLKMESKVKLVGPQYGTSKWDFISRATAVVYPTLHEAFGRVPFEALIGGSLPIIPKASGSAEYLAEFLPQCIYDDKISDSLVTTLLRVDKEASANFHPGKSQARNWVEENLTWSKISKRFIATYESLVFTECDPFRRPQRSVLP